MWFRNIPVKDYYSPQVDRRRFVLKTQEKTDKGFEVQKQNATVCVRLIQYTLTVYVLLIVLKTSDNKVNPRIYS